MHPSAGNPDAAKSCCVVAYESEWARLLLGDSLHPGGPALTQHLGEVLALGPKTRLLDVACGQGSSAIALAEAFGCSVHGIDLSEANIEAARAAARKTDVAHLLSFQAGDAEGLPVSDAAFDAVICECAFCTFPGKEQAAAEFARVLRPGGLIGLTDVTANGPLPAELSTLLGWVVCLAGAQSADAYRDHLESAGLVVFAQEGHDTALGSLVSSVKLKLLGLEVAARLGKAPVPLEDVQRGKALAKAAAAAVRNGQLGYTLIAAGRPDGRPSCTT